MQVQASNIFFLKHDTDDEICGFPNGGIFPETPLIFHMLLAVNIGQVAVQTSLCQTGSGTSKTGFLMTWLMLYMPAASFVEMQ